MKTSLRFAASRGCGAVAALLLGCAGGCGTEHPSSAVESGAPAESFDDDGGLLRAKLSACFGFGVEELVVRGLPAEAGSERGEEQSCVRSAESCEDVSSCLGYSGTSCEANGRCEDGVAVHCDALTDEASFERVEACALDPSGNTRCTEVVEDDEEAYPICNQGACADERCEGTARVYCVGDVEVREECDLEGKVCMPYWAGTLCVLTETCMESRCDGPVAVRCLEGLVSEKRDCRGEAPGGRCRMTFGESDCVAGIESPSCPVLPPEIGWCQGNVAVACSFGARVDTDCSVFAGSTCSERGAGSARCVLP
jgi:hypothetical protein